MNQPLLLFLAAVAALLFLGMHFIGRKPKGRKREVQRPISVPVLSPAIDSLKKAAEAQRLLRDRLRDRKAMNADLTSSIASAMTELGDRVSLEDAARAALEVGYPAEEVGRFMAGRQFQVQDIVELLAEDKSISVTALADAIKPLVSGTSNADKVEKIFQLVKDATDDEDDSEENLILLPGHFGCSDEESVRICYNLTDLCLGAVLRRLKLGGMPDLAARMENELRADLSDSDEYDDLREDNDIDFRAAARILKACGKDAKTVIITENDHEEFSNDLEEIYSGLSAAGFTSIEIMTGISEAGIIDDNTYGTIVMDAMEYKIPTEAIMAFLRSERIDLDELDDEMRELDVDTKKRVAILHALFHQEENPKV